MTSWGLKVLVAEHPVLLTYPIFRSVEVFISLEITFYFPSNSHLTYFAKVLSPQYYNCTLEEAVVDDGTSGNPNAEPPFNGYSASGISLLLILSLFFAHFSFYFYIYVCVLPIHNGQATLPES
jgi:hypothetical protein